MKIPNVRILGADMEPKGVCPDAVSLRYTKLFCGAGEFDLVLPQGVGVLPEPDDFVLCGSELFVADKVERSTLRGEIAVSGRGVLSMLSRRIVPTPYNRSRTVEGAACDLVRAYASSLFPAPLTVVMPEGGDDRRQFIDAGDLYDRVITLAKSVRKGVSLTWDGEGFTFAVTDGRDRRLAEPFITDAALLSESFGTIEGVREVIDRSRYMNKVYVRGSMTSNGNVILTSMMAEDCGFHDGFDDSAEALREGYVKSGIGVTMFTSTDQNGNSVFDSSGYYEALRERGRRELALHRVERSIEASLTGGAEDTVDTGDICTLSTPSGNARAVRVAAKEYSFADGKASCKAKLLTFE